MANSSDLLFSTLASPAASLSSPSARDIGRLSEYSSGQTANSSDEYSDEYPYDKQEHTRLDYPVSIYYADLSRLSMHLVRWHWHAEIEIIIIDHGEAEFLAEDTSVLLSPGQGVIVNQNVLHAIHPTEDFHCAFYTVDFNPSFLFGYGATLISTKYLSPVVDNPEFRFLLLEEEHPWHKRLIDSVNDVIAANMTRKYGYELVSKEYLCHFWMTLLEQTAPPAIPKSKRASLSLNEFRAKEALIYMESHYAEPITLDEIADSIHVSKSECCRCFKRSLQMTPFEYLMKFRIFKAASFIRTGAPASSISELALSVGFNNISYFNKVFKKYLNCTPTKYREEIKKDPDFGKGPFDYFQS